MILPFWKEAMKPIYIVQWDSVDSTTMLSCQCLRIVCIIWALCGNNLFWLSKQWTVHQHTSATVLHASALLCNQQAVPPPRNVHSALLPILYIFVAHPLFYIFVAHPLFYIFCCPSLILHFCRSHILQFSRHHPFYIVAHPQFYIFAAHPLFYISQESPILYWCPSILDILDF